MELDIKTFCHLPFTSVWIGGTGLMNPCCKADLHQQKEYQIPHHNIDDYLNSKELVQLKNDLVKGVKNPACNACWNEEAQKRISKRLEQQLFQDWQNKKFIPMKHNTNTLSLQLTNLCNLGCRMCHSFSSSVIEKEDIENSNLYFSKKYGSSEKPYWHHKEEYFDDLKKQKDWWANKNFLKQIYDILPNITYIDVSGGEPSINKTFIDILDYCIDNDFAKNIDLTVTTNGQQINPKLIERLNKFKKTQLIVSIDGYKDTYEYIRYKGSWDKLVKNIKIFQKYSKENLSLMCHMTAQVLNILNLPTLIIWLEKNNVDWNTIDIVFRPDYHNIRLLTQDVKSVALKKFEELRQQHTFSFKKKLLISNIIKALKVNDQKYADEWWPYFVRDTKLKDEIRKQSLEKSVPELYNIIKERYTFKNET